MAGNRGGFKNKKLASKAGKKGAAARKMDREMKMPRSEDIEQPDLVGGS